MIDPASVAFDIDGVFADTMTLFVDIVHREYRQVHLRYEDITSYMLDECLDIPPEAIEGAIRQILDGTHHAPLRPMAGAPDVVARLGRAHGPVLFVTARPDADFIEPWLRGVLPEGRDGVEVVATGSFEAKLDVLHERGRTVFVEDRLETCFDLDRGGVRPVVYRQPWNRCPHPFTEVADWQELARLMALS